MDNARETGTVAALLLKQAHRSMTPKEIRDHALLLASALAMADRHIGLLDKQNLTAVAATREIQRTCNLLQSGIRQALEFMSGNRECEVRLALDTMLAAEIPPLPKELVSTGPQAPRLAVLWPDAFTPKGTLK